MAYIGTERGQAVWFAGGLQDDGLTDTCICLLGGEEDPENGAQHGSKESRGFIIHDWFGPFLLGPQSRYMRGRC
jgi:hypothetical protein